MKRLLLILPVFALTALLAFKDRFSGKGLDVVNTEAGQVSGMLTPGGVHVYKGIPFARPPVGGYRWKAPQPAEKWDGVKACVAWGPSPMQGSPAPFSMWTEEFLIPKEPISEDCLYLNVWTGAKAEKEKRPVLVWIYGGGFVSGGSACPIYDGEAMAKKGIVFVSINYRVGIFGFFAHPELTAESGHQASGNYGLMDQIAGLQWVKKNIAAFGGDPDNVTIAGQSAGSMSVNCLVASPLARGLFGKAIAQSGANMVGSALGGPGNLKAAEQEGERIANSLKAGSLAELRNKSAEELMKAMPGMRGPIVDGYVLPYSVPEIFSRGEQNKVALMTGWNQDEGISFGEAKKAEEYRKDIQARYPDQAATFLGFYPGNTDEQAAESQLEFSRDLIFGVQNYTWANVQAASGSKVYVYRFTRKVPATGEYVKYGAFHTGEVPYAYNNLSFVRRPWEPVDYQLAGWMSDYWANFARTGNPNGKGLPPWPLYREKEKMILDLGVRTHEVSMPDSKALDFVYQLLRK